MPVLDTWSASPPNDFPNYVGGKIRLSNNGERGSVFGFKQPLHGSQRGGLVPGDVLALAVAGGERHQERGNHPGAYPETHKRAAILLTPLAEQVKRPHRGHDEAGRDHRPDHVVEVLPEQPGVQQPLALARSAESERRPERPHFIAVPLSTGYPLSIQSLAKLVSMNIVFTRVKPICFNNSTAGFTFGQLLQGQQPQ